MTSGVPSRAKKRPAADPQAVQARTVPPEQQIATATAWQGPLPPPESLERFNAIVEHGAERIFHMAELEQQHRIESERRALDSNIQAAKAETDIAWRGHQYGAGISALAILATVVSVVLGAHWAVSVALVGVPLMSAVRALIVRK